MTPEDFEEGNRILEAMQEAECENSFEDYLTDADTDTENSSLSSDRRWVWYCKLRSCPDYYSAWTCITKFLLDL